MTETITITDEQLQELVGDDTPPTCQYDRPNGSQCGATATWQVFWACGHPGFLCELHIEEVHAYLTGVWVCPAHGKTTVTRVEKL